jgi:hypothetical protein
MEEVGAECGVKAEAIVFLDYSKDFSIRGRAVLSAWRSSAVVSPGGARGSNILRRHGAVLRQKNRTSTLATESRAKHEGVYRGLPRGLLYIFPGAGTLRENASAN